MTIREGFLEMAEAAQLFAAADTVALPYPSASQSGVLLLAYGFHRPVIAYPVGGLLEAVIDGETGWLCARPDVDALVDALAASIDAGAQECLRRGERGAQLADERFSWPAIARRTDELYREVLARVSERSRADEARSARLLLGVDMPADALTAEMLTRGRALRRALAAPAIAAASLPAACAAQARRPRVRARGRRAAAGGPSGRAGGAGGRRAAVSRARG